MGHRVPTESGQRSDKIIRYRELFYLHRPNLRFGRRPIAKLNPPETGWSLAQNVICRGELH